jgi:hypothetical protein
MPEIKHIFNQGKMNKDLDERLIPNGQYIDANNIQVSTSDTDDVGTVQSLLGNSAIPVASPTTISDSGFCVGAIADESNNTAYWLIADTTDWVAAAPSSILTYKDFIYKSVYNSTTNTHTTTPVFIDFWLEKHPTPASGDWTGSNPYTAFTTTTTNLSTGMYVKLVGTTSSVYRQITVSGSTVTLDVEVYKKDWDWIEFSWQVPDTYGSSSFTDSPQFKKRVLRFDKNILITGLNIIDDLLFWTDNNSEPKKINLTRALAGTDASDLNKSTKVFVNGVEYGYYKESDITVIKKNPETAPVIDLSTSDRSGIISTTTTFNFDDVSINDTIEIETTIATNYKPNDTILFGHNITPSSDNFHVKARIKVIEDTTVTLQMLSKQNAPSGSNTYNIILEHIAKNLFEEKFVRFATRWKYVDGEYSTISPFSDIAFIPDEFNYETIKGYNAGMINQVKEVIIKDFIPVNISKEVVQIDILYKESNSPIIYTVDNISKTDIVINGSTNAWNTVNDSFTFQGKYTITSENIYAAIPSNQILRHFDNVPRRALAQSITGNRVVYGNYLQNYNLKDAANDIVKPQLSALISPRLNNSAELLANPLVTPINHTTGNIVDGWNMDNSWSLTAGFYNTLFLGGGFEEKNPSTGVSQYDKISQNINFKNDGVYRIKFKVENYVQGVLRLQLIASNKFARKDINANGEYNFTLKLDTVNGGGQNNLYNNGTTFSLQSLSASFNWKGQISNFSCQEIVDSKKSIKSQRNYQIGVVYADEFGRQTPVLTDETASLKVPKSESVNANSIKVKLQNNPPVFAYSFKFFVKETSSEYYNLAMDRIYSSIDDNVWISFPSSERNKVDEETYLVLKKQIEGPAVLQESATYKILAIENEAPEYIRLTRNALGSGVGLNASAGINTLFGDTNYRPTDDQTVLAIKKDIWINNDDGAPLDGLSNLVLRFKDGTSLSSYYKVDLLSVKDINGTDYYMFHLNSPISDYDASWIMSGTNLNTGVSFIVSEEKDEARPEFNGKFFVKLLLDDNLRNFVLSQAALSESNVGIVARTEAWYASDDGVVGNDIGTATRYQKLDENILVQTTITNDIPFNGSDDFDFSGESSYSPARGTTYLDGGNRYMRLSEEAVLKWNRILKFKLYANTQINPLNDDNNSTRKNFFIDNVSYIGIQPLNQDLPANGTFKASGYWDHKNNKAVKTSGKFGRGIFEADGSEKQFDGVTTDTWFTPGKYYMELSYSKIWAESNLKDIDGSNIDTASSWSDAWSVGSPNNSNHINEQEFVKKLKVGGKFRFSGDASEKVYTITKIKKERRWNHTAYPFALDASGNEFIVSRESDGTYVRPSNLSTNNSYSFKNSQSFENPSAGVRQIVNETATLALRGTDSINNEKDRFGLATNRRLTWIIELDDAPGFNSNYDPLNRTSGTSSTLMDENTPQFIEFVEPSLNDERQLPSNEPAIFETQPKTNEGLDIYYEASDFISVGNHTVFHELPWFNCYSFGNGVESNRIKDDFNQVIIDKNPRASTTFQGQYEEERRKYGLIYSGLYNSTSGVNETNQFIAAEKITKDVNPEYGSIQKLHTRNSDLLTLCEDKVLSIQANKDALFNADGNINVTASSNVLGQTIPFAGDYGISKNPESFVTQNYRAYFTDKQRGAVLRLSMDGLTDISDAGMGTWFEDNLKSSTTILGTYDNDKKEYNVTLKGSSNYTVSYKENVKGWTSFKSFIPEQGLSIANNYYTIAPESSNLKIWWHHNNTTYNNFYGTQYYSDVTFVFNQEPSTIKTFKTLNYEGTQAKVDQNTNTDEGEYYNLTAETGWYTEDITTDKQSGSLNEFIEKEGKWFNYIKGDTTTLSNLDTGEFNVQGLGTISSHTTAN